MSNTISIRNSSSKPVHDFNAPDYLPPIDKTTSKAPEYLPPNIETKVPDVKSTTVTRPDERGDIPDEDFTTISPVIVKLVPPDDATAGEPPDTPVLSISSSRFTIPTTDTSESSILMEEKSPSMTTPSFEEIENLPREDIEWRYPFKPTPGLSGAAPAMAMPVPPEPNDNDSLPTPTSTTTTKIHDHHKIDESCTPSYHHTGPVYLPPKDSKTTVPALHTPQSPTPKPATAMPVPLEPDYDPLPTPPSTPATIPDHLMETALHTPQSNTPKLATAMPVPPGPDDDDPLPTLPSTIPDHQMEESHPLSSFTGPEYLFPDTRIIPIRAYTYSYSGKQL
ncbi:uncharacterized protein LOC134803048 [Cydia splendana]|uniref:uncharacterized protein LOC134803048 n=1 Tax=Cydia splendana TaxID=1100963 RepID=UPI00300DAFE3